MGFHLRLLHVSEVPARGRARQAAWDWRQSGVDAWLRHLEPLCDDGDIDLVCVTGRAAGRGLDRSHSRATGFLATTLDRLGLGRERLFLAPGTIPSGSRPADARPAPPGCRRELRLARLPFVVQVISLDSAWLGAAAGARRPWLTTAVVERLASGPLGEPLPGFRLGLLQQRLSELDVVPATARRLAKRVDLLLSGDARAVEVAGGAAWLNGDDSTPRSRTWSRRARQPQDCPRHLPSPRCDRRLRCVAQVITVTCDAAGRPCRVILRLGTASPAVTPHRRGARCSAAATPADKAAAVPVATAVDPAIMPGRNAGAASFFPAAAAEPGSRRLGLGLAEDCARAARLARSADRLLARGRAEDALHIYRRQLLPLYQTLAALPPRNLLVRKIAEALARLEGPGAPDQPGDPAGLDPSP